jgi:hypothetical protein
MNEHRRTHRVGFDCLVEFESGEFRHVCELFDISLQGALIGNCSGATPPAGLPCKLIISLDEENERQIIMEGTIAHKIENRVGIRCEAIDLDSMTHLRKLLEFKLGDSLLANRDFAALVHH